MSNNANKPITSASTRAILEEKVKEDPFLLTKLQLTPRDACAAAMMAMNKESPKLAKASEENPEAFNQWAETTLALLYESISMELQGINVDELMKDISCNDALFVSVQVAILLYTILGEILKLMGKSMKATANIEILNNALKTLQNGGMNDDNRVVPRRRQGAAGAARGTMTVDEARELAILAGDLDLLQDGLKRVKQSRNRETQLEKLKAARKYVILLIQISGAAAFILGGAYMGEEGLHSGSIAAWDKAQHAADLVDATWRKIPFIGGDNPYAVPQMPAIVFEELWAYNKTYVPPPEVDLGTITLADLKFQSRAYKNFGQDLEVQKTMHTTEQSRAKLTILNFNGIRNLGSRIVAAEKNVNTTLAATYGSMNPTRMFWNVTDRNTAYKDAVNARDGLLRLNETLKANDFLGFATSPDIQYLDPADQAPFREVGNSGLAEAIPGVQAAIDAQGSQISEFISYNEGTQTYSISGFDTFVKEQKTNLSKNKNGRAIRISPSVQAFIDYQFGELIAPFYTRFTDYLTSAGNAIDTQVSSINTQIQIVQSNSNFAQASREIEDLAKDCGGKGTQELQDTLVCRNLVATTSTTVIQWLQNAQSLKLNIPRQIMPILTPYLLNPNIHPTQNLYEILRLQTRLRSQESTNWIPRIIFALISLSGASWILVNLEKGLGIISNSINIIALPIEAVATLAKAGLIRAKASRDAAERERRIRAFRGISTQREALRNLGPAIAGLLAAPPGNAGAGQGQLALGAPNEIRARQARLLGTVRGPVVQEPLNNNNNNNNNAGPAARGNAAAPVVLLPPPPAPLGNPGVPAALPPPPPAALPLGNAGAAAAQQPAGGRRRVRRAKTSKKQKGLKKRKATRRH
jgi:hypothetical protein